MSRIDMHKKAKLSKCIYRQWLQKIVPLLLKNHHISSPCGTFYCPRQPTKLAYDRSSKHSLLPHEGSLAEHTVPYIFIVCH